MDVEEEDQMQLLRGIPQLKLKHSCSSFLVVVLSGRFAAQTMRCWSKVTNLPGRTMMNWDASLDQRIIKCKIRLFGHIIRRYSFLTPAESKNKSSPNEINLYIYYNYWLPLDNNKWEEEDERISDWFSCKSPKFRIQNQIDWSLFINWNSVLIWFFREDSLPTTSCATSFNSTRMIGDREPCTHSC